MKAEYNGNSVKRANSEYERQKYLNFIEELSWLIDSNKDINLKNATKFISEIRNSSNKVLVNEIPGDEYKLIGILPSLMKDVEIFKTNAQLVQFATEVLTLEIPRWEKKSRNEIIGLIICEVEDANKERLNLLADWSSDILCNKKKIQELQKSAKSTGNMFSWNETIQKLTGNSYE